MTTQSMTREVAPLDHWGTLKIILTTDLCKGFWQIIFDEESGAKIAFVISGCDDLFFKIWQVVQPFAVAIEAISQCVPKA